MRQAILNLLAFTPNPTVLVGEAMDAQTLATISERQYILHQFVANLLVWFFAICSDLRLFTFLCSL